jgi:hypothetical protein
MFISEVDQGLERLLRQQLPLSEQVGDISFEAPNDTWAASLSRLTVNLFLYQVERSSQPGRAPVVRTGEDGPSYRRRSQPMIELGYLISAWAGSPRDEHQLLGDIVSLLAGISTLPEEVTPPGLSSTVSLALGGELKPRDIWQGLGGKLRPSLMLSATVAADTWDWELQAPLVDRLSVLSSPSPVPPQRG